MENQRRIFLVARFVFPEGVSLFRLSRDGFEMEARLSSVILTDPVNDLVFILNPGSLEVMAPLPLPRVIRVLVVHYGSRFANRMIIGDLNFSNESVHPIRVSNFAAPYGNTVPSEYLEDTRYILGMRFQTASLVWSVRLFDEVNTMQEFVYNSTSTLLTTGETHEPMLPRILVDRVDAERIGSVRSSIVSGSNQLEAMQEPTFAPERNVRTDEQTSRISEGRTNRGGSVREVQPGPSSQSIVHGVGYLSRSQRRRTNRNQRILAQVRSESGTNVQRDQSLTDNPRSNSPSNMAYDSDTRSSVLSRAPDMVRDVAQHSMPLPEHHPEAMETATSHEMDEPQPGPSGLQVLVTANTAPVSSHRQNSTHRIGSSSTVTVASSVASLTTTSTITSTVSTHVSPIVIDSDSTDDEGRSSVVSTVSATVEIQAPPIVYHFRPNRYQRTEMQRVLQLPEIEPSVVPLESENFESPLVWYNYRPIYGNNFLRVPDEGDVGVCVLCTMRFSDLKWPCGHLTCSSCARRIHFEGDFFYATCPHCKERFNWLSNHPMCGNFNRFVAPRSFAYPFDLDDMPDIHGRTNRDRQLEEEYQNRRYNEDRHGARHSGARRSGAQRSEDRRSGDRRRHHRR